MTKCRVQLLLLLQVLFSLLAKVAGYHYRHHSPLLIPPLHARTKGPTQRDQRDAILINKLVTKVVETVQTALRSNNSSQTPSKPFQLQFKARHKSKFGLPEPSKALKYLALPLSNYSALDTKFIRLKEDDNVAGQSLSDNDKREQCFTLSLPLFDMTSALSFPVDALLTTDISVMPDAENGKIRMYSGPVYFIPDNNTRTRVTSTVQSLYPVTTEQDPGNTTNINDGSSNSNSNGDAKDSFDLLEERLAYEENVSLKRFIKEKKEVTRSQIPNWLIWGGSLDGEPLPSDGQVFANDTAIKSSIQASIYIDMIWNRNGNRQTLGNFFGAKSASNLDKVDETLPVESSVQVKVDLNLPVKGSAAFVLGLLPLRAVIAQIGSLIAGTIMRSLAPVFVDALIKDYIQRKDLLSDEQQ